MSESESNTEAESSDEETEYKRTTLYLRGWMKRDYERWFGLLELNMLDFDSGVVEIAEKREMHEALVATAMNNSEEFVERLNTRRNDPERFELEVEELLP